MLLMLRVAPPKPDLIEPASSPHSNAKASRRDLSVKRTVIAARDMIEDFGSVGNQPGKDVKTPRRTLRICDSSDCLRKLQIFLQLNNVYPTLLKYGSITIETNCFRLQLLELLLYSLIAPWQEACPHSVRLRSKPQVETRRLKLAVIDL